MTTRNDALSQLIIDCENQLGCVLKGDNIYKARATAHRILTVAMVKNNVNLADLQLALAYAKRRRILIDSPLHLIGFVQAARTRGVDAQPKQSDLDTQQQEAIDWENSHPDDLSEYWVGRLIRSVGTARADVLQEWTDAGRGTDDR